MHLKDLIHAVSNHILNRALGSVSSRYQIDIDLYIRLLCQPGSEKVNNVLIIRGGNTHFKSDEAYYIRMLCLGIRFSRVFMLEKMQPMINPKYDSSISKCINWIKERYEGKIFVVGFSMGGIYTFFYLSRGLNEADGYLTVSSPVNLHYFQETVNRDPVYSYLQKQLIEIYGVSTFDQLLSLAGTDHNEVKCETDQLYPNLVKQKENGILQHLGSIIGTDDILTQTFCSDCNEDLPIRTLSIRGGTHCCMSSVWYACRILWWCNFCSCTIPEAIDLVTKEEKKLFSF